MNATTLNREQIHATLTLKGYERCGTRSYFMRTKDYCLVFTAGAQRPTPQPADWRPFTPPHKLMPARFAAELWERIEWWESRQKECERDPVMFDLDSTRDEFKTVVI